MIKYHYPNLAQFIQHIIDELFEIPPNLLPYLRQVILVIFFEPLKLFKALVSIIKI